MSIDSATNVATSQVVRADVCVIGSGAAGLTLARELDGAGLDVVLLEAGGLERAETEADDFRFDAVGLPFRDDIEARGRWFGGSTNLWFGRIALPSPIDFEERPWVPHSGWPISYDDVAAHFPAAARLLDLPEWAQLDIRRWPPDPTIATFRGGDAELQVFLWADGMFMGERARPQLAASRNVRVLLDATAVELVPAERGDAIQRVVAATGDGRRFDVEATTFVLAAGGLENPRLLLASTQHAPHGVGNGHDLVGRYYLDHPRTEALARVDLRGLSAEQIARVRLLGEKAASPFGEVQLRVVFSAELQRREQLLNHSAHAHLVTEAQLTPAFDRLRARRDALRARTRPTLAEVAEDLRAVARSLPALGRAAVQRIRVGARPAELLLVDQMEHEPDPDSRVTLRHDDRDRFGLPRLQVDWRVGESTRRSQLRMHELVRARLAAVGITTFTSELLDEPDRDVPILDMRHPSGTTRMAASPTDGVVDRDCRVHGVDNLYVMGSSVFPTVGHFNPTFVIVALAVRLAERLRQELGRSSAGSGAAAPNGEGGSNIS